MSNSTSKQNELKQRWDAIYNGAAQAIDWIEEVRVTAPRLDREADNLNLRLRRARNLARSLAQVAVRPMTIGFFGLSQAGKSHLISVLAAGENNRLETDFGSKRIDFLQHVNPVGGGKEATGLVTRFSRTARSGPPDFPVELRLFNEIELAKLLTNAYFNDFDQQRTNYEMTEERIHAFLKRFEGMEGGAKHPGVEVDDVVDLYDYVIGSFEQSVKKLELEYWPRAFVLAPYLAADQRAELFSILWGEQPELTRTYQQLAATLRKLGNRQRAYAPLDALVTWNSDGSTSQVDSIMNVDILERLGSPSDTTITVRPADGDNLDGVVSVSVAQLAALTAELTFPLINPTRNPQVEQVDLLDFPGYRGRLKIGSVADAAASSKSSDGNPVSQLILRSKVAYLFERYTDNQEMNGLVLCSSAIKQSDVNDVGPVLTRWIEKTQGANAEERSRRASGLMWAITMMDLRVQNSLKLTQGQLSEGWEGLIKMAMLERFGQFPWMQQWQTGSAFNNTFLLRKPGEDVPFLVVANGSETSVQADKAGVLETMEETFVASPSISKYVAQAQDAWQAMLQLNDGGLTRLSNHLTVIANLDFKLQRIEEQLASVMGGLVEHGLGSMLQKGGEEALARKKEIAHMLGANLPKRRSTIGELIHYLDLPEERLRELYLSGDTLEEATGENSTEVPAISSSYLGDDSGFALDNPFDSESPFGSFSEPGVASKPAALPTLQSNDHRFARSVFKAWMAHLRELPERAALLDVLGLDKKIVEATVDELITAANRLDLETKVQQAILARAQSGAKKDQLVARQVLTAQLALRDFVAWLGHIEQSVERRPNSYFHAKQPVFSGQPGIAPGQLPELPDQAMDQAAVFVGDWVSAVVVATTENAGFAGSEITAEQNERLGIVLNTFKAGVVNAA